MNPLDLIEAAHGLTGAAELVRAYYVALVGTGFTEEEAMALTIAWQTAMLATAPRNES